MITVTPKKNAANMVVVRGVGKRSVTVLFNQNVFEYSKITDDQFETLAIAVGKVASKKRWRIVHVGTLLISGVTYAYNTHMDRHMGTSYRDGVLVTQNYRSL